jgi:hypothetical protein
MLMKHTLIDLGKTKNVMTKEIIEILKLQGLLQQIPAILKMVNGSTIKLEGILEVVVVYINSLEYPVDFMVLYAQINLSGYSLILERHWLVIGVAYIWCSSRDMTISQGNSITKLTLYPLAMSILDMDESLLV